jgi:D-alanine-D-alanine ligase
VRCPAEIDASLAAELSRLAVAAFRATGCRDYARVDFRLDAQGAPMILEVNPNPDLDPSAGVARAMRVAGQDYAETLAALVRQALARGSRP